jgi:hypothetical protein
MTTSTEDMSTALVNLGSPGSSMASRQIPRVGFLDKALKSAWLSTSLSFRVQTSTSSFQLANTTMHQCFRSISRSALKPNQYSTTYFSSKPTPPTSLSLSHPSTPSPTSSEERTRSKSRESKSMLFPHMPTPKTTWSASLDMQSICQISNGSPTVKTWSYALLIPSKTTTLGCRSN